LQVASAAVPKFAPHTNTLDSPGRATTTVTASNRVYHDAQHPSRLLLPVTEGWEDLA
jgi:predicted acyl esterase